MTDPDCPTFVVVGNVNQGKSSVVATLTEDRAVPIADHPGTTTRAGVYSCRIGTQEVFRLVDTPGFQEPRRALAWLQQRAGSAAERAAAVHAFVETHRNQPAYRDEVELLTPVLEGCGILYVVDASARVQPTNEAEMEILRWTGQPAMALINRTRDRDFTEAWRPVLTQFFNLVRTFDAHGATFEDRISLLQGFRELRTGWQAPLDRAIAALRDERRDRTTRAAAAVADLMVRALGHVERRPLPQGADEAPARAELEQTYRDTQRQLEQQARKVIEDLYHHEGLARVEDDLEVLGTDLFSDASWRLFGLSRAQLAKYGAAWGAIAGGAIDLMVGGLSFFAGAGLGAGVGALTGWFGGTEVARVWGNSSNLAKTLFPGDTGRFLSMGPVTSPRFAWMLLDRALLHWTAVRRRSHAQQGELQLTAGMVQELPADTRSNIDKALRDVLQGALQGSVSTEARAALRDALARLPA